jgi:hypothetical protein
VRLPVKCGVCVKSTFLSLCLAEGAVGVQNIKFELSVFHNYLCLPSPSINPDNREYTVVPTILFESPKGPSDEKCLGPTNTLIRHCPRRENVDRGLQGFDAVWSSRNLPSGRTYPFQTTRRHNTEEDHCMTHLYHM